MTGLGGGSDTGNSGGDEMCDPSLLLAMTPGCVEGYKIESAAWADSYCVDNFGDGWIWLEHHQQGGWFVQGTWIDDNGIGERGWVYVNDQMSACYETDYGVTWVRAAFPDWQCRADCWSTIGLEGPEYQPQDGLPAGRACSGGVAGGAGLRNCCRLVGRRRHAPGELRARRNRYPPRHPRPLHRSIEPQPADRCKHFCGL